MGVYLLFPMLEVKGIVLQSLIMTKQIVHIGVHLLYGILIATEATFDQSCC